MNGINITQADPMVQFQGLGIEHLLGSQPPAPEAQDIGPCESTELCERPYLGLWDVYADGTAEGLARRLIECAEHNAHPDWVRWETTANACGLDVIDRHAVLNAALSQSHWPQTEQDVMREIECRNAGLFVVQRFYAPITFTGEINVGGK